MAGTLTPTRDQLKRWVTDNEGTDEDLLRKIEQVFFGVEDLPNLQDGIDNNTLTINTLSDLVRPITIDLVEPLPSPVGGDTTYTLTGGEATEGMKTILIPAASLVATAAGPFTLIITTGSGSTVLVPITVSTNTITSGDLMFDIHIDSSGNVVGKSWEVTGNDGSATYSQSSSGIMHAARRLALGTASQTWTFPVPFSANPIVQSLMISGSNARMPTLDTISTTAATILGWNDAGAANADPRNISAFGRWRT